MGMFDAYNVFPILKTQRIIIQSDKVTIRGLLSTKEFKENASTWLGTSRFTQYVKVCFAVVPKLFLPNVERVYSPSSRFSADGDNTFDQFMTRYATVSMSLDEILQNDYASSVGASDLEGGMQVNDLFFEMVLDMNQSTSVVPSYSFEAADMSWNVTDHAIASSFETWHLIGFLHFDYQLFSADHAPVTNLNMFGGNCTVDIMLEKTQDYSGGRQVKVPETTKAFLFGETWPIGSMQNSEIPVEHHAGELYYGITHFHDGDRHESLIFDVDLNRYVQDPNAPDPAPGYVGWMGGNPQDPGRGPKLDVIQVPYTKVIANELIRSTPLEDGAHYGAADWFHSSYDENDELPRNMNQMDQTTVTNLIRDWAHTLGSSAKKTVEDVRRQVVYKNKVANSNILFRSTASAIRVVQNGNQISDASCHQVLCFVSLEDLLATHSPLGWLVEYHLHDNPSLVAEFISASRIKNVTLTRKRMSNYPEGNVYSSSPDYVTYDNDEIPKVLVSTSDMSNQRHLQAKINPGIARISEQRDSSGHPSWKFAFLLEDYDLFHNVTCGNYEYSAEFHIMDGAKTVLEERINAYNQARVEMNRYLNYMNTPCTFGISEVQNDYPWLSGLYTPDDERTTEVISGRFNWKTNRYRTSRETRDSWRSIVDAHVSAFVEVYKVLTNTPHGEPAGTSWEDYKTGLVSTLLRPHVGWLELLVNFQDMVATELEGILKRGNISKYERISSGLLTPSLDTSKEKRILCIKAKIPELVTAFSRTQVFYEPDLGDLRT
jgi:hypothetical protein